MSSYPLGYWGWVEGSTRLYGRKNKLLMTKTFLLRMFKDELPYRTVTSQVLRIMMASMSNRLQGVIQRGGTTTKY
jgi:hypothetical protein